MWVSVILKTIVGHYRTLNKCRGAQRWQKDSPLAHITLAPVRRTDEMPIVDAGMPFKR
jgi:hypothetical protein